MRACVQAGVLKLGEDRLCRVPHLDGVDVGTDQLLQMCGQGLAVDLWGAAGPSNALSYVEDDACETILVDENLLGVGDLAKRTVLLLSASEHYRRIRMQSRVGSEGERSAAPPESHSCDGLAHT